MLQEDESVRLAGTSMQTVQGADNELVARARPGDFAAFEELTNRHERRVYSLALRILRNVADAEDATQQTFLSALENVKHFRGDSMFITWLLRIATHASLKIIRKQRGLRTVPLEIEWDENDEYRNIPHPEYIADWRDSPETLIHRKEVSDLLDDALEELDEKHRLVFLLRDVEGLSIRETAKTLGITEANTKVRLLRARLQLREALTLALGDPATRIETVAH
jgi:RNA polymerase sigma-70 factor (ECF subfamily)